MKIFRKAFIFSLVFLLVFLVFGCKKSEPREKTQEETPKPAEKKADVDYPELTEFNGEPSVGRNRKGGFHTTSFNHSTIG